MNSSGSGFIQRGGVGRGGRGYGNHGRGGGGGVGRGGPRGSGQIRVFDHKTPRRDLEEELLVLIQAEFQINCVEVRPFAEIYERVRQNPDVHGYIDNSPEQLRKFIESYSENFTFTEKNPNNVRWAKTRIASRRDPKEARRRERREWEKNFEATRIPYDIGLEDNVLTFITALFLLADESWLSTQLIEKCVKMAFWTEVDLLDYAGNVRNFLLKRSHMFSEHFEQILFNGKDNYDVIFKLNLFIRGSVQTKNRETVRRLHEFYLSTSTIGEKARTALLMEDRRSFCLFLLRCSYVFKFELDDSHVESKMDLPQLRFDTNEVMNVKSFKPVLDEFMEMHARKQAVVTEEQTETYLMDRDGLPMLVGHSKPKGQRAAACDAAGGCRPAGPSIAAPLSVVTATPSDVRPPAEWSVDGTFAGNFFDGQDETAQLTAARLSLSSLRLAASLERAAFLPSSVAAHRFLQTPGGEL